MTKGMSILILLILFLLSVSAQAQDVEVPFFPLSSRISILYPMPDVMYVYDQHGNSIIFYRQWSGLVWYSARDSSGRVAQEGYRVAPPLAFDLHRMPPMNQEAPDQDLR